MSLATNANTQQYRSLSDIRRDAAMRDLEAQAENDAWDLILIVVLLSTIVATGIAIGVNFL